MRRRSRLVRACHFAVALLQLSATGAAAWVDALLDAGGSRAPVHLETRSSGRCPPVHPPDCILHQFLSTPGTAGRPHQLIVQPDPVRITTVALGRVMRSPLHERLPDSRAPPPLS
jgi:hypothetical protein